MILVTSHCSRLVRPQTLAIDQAVMVLVWVGSVPHTLTLDVTKNANRCTICEWPVIAVGWWSSGMAWNARSHRVFAFLVGWLRRFAAAAFRYA